MKFPFLTTLHGVTQLKTQTSIETPYITQLFTYECGFLYQLELNQIGLEQVPVRLNSGHSALTLSRVFSRVELLTPLITC